MAPVLHFFLSQLSNSNHFKNLSKSQYEQKYSFSTDSDLLIVVPSEHEANIVYTDISGGARAFKGG